MTKEYLHNMYNATSTDDGSGDIESYESWLIRQLISRLKKEIESNVLCMKGDRFIKVGDICKVMDGSEVIFEVVFEDNAIRKKYIDWDKSLVKPLLEDLGSVKFKIINR